MVLRTQVLNNLIKEQNQLLKGRSDKGRLRIFPPIHPPLPLGKRESQQLLNAITSSFRKKLDEEHPLHTHDNSATSTSDINHDLAQQANGRAHHRPTDLHLASILSNPLFAAPNTKSRQSASHHVSRPNHVFDSAVNKGLMTLERATGYLTTVERCILSSEGLDIRKAMAESGAGSRIVQWLRTSGLETHLDFTLKKAFMRKLCGFMLAEGMDEILWAWLSQLTSRLRSLTGDAELRLQIGTLLLAILHGHVFPVGIMRTFNTSLDDAYSTLMRSNEILHLPDPGVQRLLRSGWGILSWESTVNASMRPKPSPQLYDMFVNFGRPYRQAFRIDFAHLALHHPTHPDHLAAINYLHDQDVPGGVTPQKPHNPRIRRMMSLGTDTISRLEEVGQSEEAHWVTEFMTRSFHSWKRPPKGDNGFHELSPELMRAWAWA